MKDEKWLAYVIIGFTSITTVLLLADNTFLGFVRAIVAAVLLDGLIMFWDEKRVTLKDKDQRKYSNYMMWTGVGIMLFFAAGYGVELFAPVDAVKTLDLFGFVFTSTLHDGILMLAASMIGVWVVLTLGVYLYLRQIDPDILAELERVKATEEAEKELRKIEDTAYKTAMTVASNSVGTENAIRAYRARLQSANIYTEFQINQMVEEARLKIEMSRTGGIPVNVNSYQAEVNTPELNPTRPSTPPK